jgi:hypothetical protein
VNPGRSGAAIADDESSASKQDRSQNPKRGAKGSMRRVTPRASIARNEKFCRRSLPAFDTDPEVKFSLASRTEFLHFSGT